MRKREREIEEKKRTESSYYFFCNFSEIGFLNQFQDIIVMREFLFFFFVRGNRKKIFIYNI